VSKPACWYVLFALAVLPANADFQAGLAAYDRGDYSAALSEWRPIAESGDANAQFNLGMLYARGQGVPQDYQKAVEWYQKAGEQGVAAAQYNLGLIYANGQGVPRNAEEAARWFQKAAEQGVTAAESDLGSIYYEGEGAFKNYAEAEKWYRKAAEQGIGSAAFSLGVMYDIGQGVDKNYDEAIKWYTKAADAGYAPALTNLGILYYNAQGVKRDLVQAYAWFARAEKMGDPRAGQLFRTTASRMKPKDVKQAQALVEQWHPAGKAAQTEEAKLFKQPAMVAAKLATPAAVPAEQSPAAESADREAAPKKTDQPAKTSAPIRQSTWTGVDRVVAIGDLHGDYEQFVLALESAGLVDGNANWTGGKTHLVQTGDVVDRGPDSRAIMDLLMRLETQAREAGGAVHALIGNHEAMDVYGDLRYVSPAEFSTFSSTGTEATRQTSYDELRRGVTAPATPESNQAQPEPKHTPGFEEHRAAFGPAGKYGQWLRSHDTAIKINRTLFVHAGIGLKYSDWSLDRINQEVRDELSDLTRLHGGIVIDQEGPLWYPGLAKGGEPQLSPLVDSLLARFDVDRIVIGHTFADGAITPRFAGKVLLIDVGLSRIYDNLGRLACLEIDGDHAYALHRGQKLELPRDEKGPDMLRYLRAAAALDPSPSPLLGRISALSGSQAER
jgi:TPR repeat protein